MEIIITISISILIITVLIIILIKTLKSDKKIKDKFGTIQELLNQEDSIKEQINLSLKEQDNIDNNITSLLLKQSELNYQIENQKTKFEVYEEKRIALDDSFRNYCDILDIDYSNKEKEYDEKIYQLQDKHRITEEQIELKKQELDSLVKKHSLAIEILNKEKTKQEKKEYNCLKISESDESDIIQLEDVRKKLSKPCKRILSMLIWEHWFQKQLTLLCNNTIGTNKTCGIYKITNICTDECYIGQSVDIAARFKQHAKCGLGIDTPENNKLYKAMQEYGLWNFSWDIIEICSASELNEKERFYIELFNSYNYGYNSTKGNKT